MDSFKRRINLLESDVVPTKSELRTQMKDEIRNNSSNNESLCPKNYGLQ